MTSREFLVHIHIDGVPPETLESLQGAETKRAKELATSGNLKRLWRLPEGWSNMGLWCANDEAALNEVLQTLPLHPYMMIEIRALQPHPSDPITAG